MKDPGVIIEILKDAIKYKVQREHLKELDHFEVTFSGSFAVSYTHLTLPTILLV